MTLAEAVQASTLFVIIIVFIVLMGILFTELFKRKDRKDVFYLLLVLFGIIAKIILDTYWDFAGHESLILGPEGLSLDFLLLFGVAIIFYKLRKKINKKIVLLIIVSSVILITTSFSLLAITPLIELIPSGVSWFLLSSLMGLLQAILVMIISIASYLLIIKFLVDNPRK